MSGRFRPSTAAALAVAVTLTLILGTASADATAADTATGSADSITRSAVEAYWTETRMTAATAMAEANVPASSSAPAETGVSESAGGDAGPADTVSANSADAAQLAYFRQSKVWAGHGKMPARSIGKLFFTTPDGDHYCTATVINSANHSTIWTAGHCVSNGHKGWYKNFKFAPDYHNGSRPYGTWTAKSWAVPNGYHDGADSYYDMAALALNSNSRGKAGDVVGWQGYRFGGSAATSTYGDTRAFGYAQDTHPARSGISSTGEDLRFCVGSSYVPAYRVISCDLGHGASGGPWITDMPLSRGWGYLIGSHSYHIGSSPDLIYGPPLGQAAINVRKAVQAD